ncbi:hypothetical protein LRS06_22365 [Hymenobacter sp. J193]|uniref:hypothetical protein n=1 Tax=Hymenobacter sp. J193 TaxID=2898429 RepID=UPI00215177A7|nr:hypothetical protein [Hymenobacter sp. J193]MCR5890476.1 hypothetical protein [Hymenobacter sp. J193]
MNPRQHLQPAVATTTSVSEQPFRTVGISIVEEGLQQRAQQLRQDLQQQGAIVSELQKRESGQDLSRQHFTARLSAGPTERRHSPDFGNSRPPTRN